MDFVSPNPQPWHESYAVVRGLPPNYVITEVIPPTRRTVLSEFCQSDYGLVPCGDHTDGISVVAGDLTFWRRAMARVGSGDTAMVELQSLVRVDITPRLAALSEQYAEQQRLAREFAVGDGVLFGAAKRPRYGVILEIVYPSVEARDLPLVAFDDIQVARWPTLVGGSAILKNLDRRGVPAVRPSQYPLSALTKTDKAPPMDERWRGIWQAMTTSPMTRSMRRKLKLALSKPAAG